MNTWTGNIGLVNVSDVLKASTNPACTSVTDQYDQLSDSMISTCNSNYLVDLPYQGAYWTINNAVWESADYSSFVWLAAQYEGTAVLDSIHAGIGSIFGARPVLYLSSDITLTGTGSSSDPYQIA